MLKRLLLMLYFLSLCNLACFSQVPVTVSAEQGIENAVLNNDNAEPEDDDYLRQMQEYARHPLDLNTADEDALKSLLVLSPLQIGNFISYRMLLGKLLSVYELQAIPSWDIATIGRIQPFITVSNEKPLFLSVKSRLRKGDHLVLFRISQVMEKPAGYTADSGRNYYTGSPQKLLLRYTYRFKNVLQYGIVAEKDAGEQFFKGAQRTGFDFYSPHFFVRDIGIIRALALGDYTVNLGQGLVTWQNLAFGKGSDIAGIKRQSAVLRPYHSAGETNFHRGAGITLGRRGLEATCFLSYRKIDGNFITDTANGYISSLQASGYHRTRGEQADRNIQRQLAFGVSLSWQFRRLRLHLNTVQYRFKLPLYKDDQPYNSLALSGKRFGNSSLEFGFTRQNLHFFGELALSNLLHTAFTGGLLTSAARNVDIGIFYRHIAAGYQALYASGFTESGTPSNERGLYAGITVRPAIPWRIDAYLDMYRFPWLKYRVDKPSTGSDYTVQLTYKPNKQLEIYSRYHAENKALNSNPDGLPLAPVSTRQKQQWRTNFSFKVSPAVTLRNRVELVWVNRRMPGAETGSLFYVDFLYKPLLKPYSLTARWQYFETGGYDSRLYAYENDLLYSYSIPVFYEKGGRYYVNINYDVNKKLSAWARVARSGYRGKTSIGSGLDEIPGNHKTELKLQLQYRF